MPNFFTIANFRLLHSFLPSISISSTGKNLLNRIKELATSEKSEVCKHLLQHPTHRDDSNTTTILGCENVLLGC